MKVTDLAPDRASLLKLEARFWSKVDVRDEDECWPWNACMGTSGDSQRRKTVLRYGRFGVAPNGTTNAHRVSYVLAVGEVPNGLMVLHHCDNPPCCNPAHLFMGTGKDNATDRETKGRGIAGNRKLEDWQVGAIVRAHEECELTQRQLADAFGVGQSTINRVLNGVSHVRIARIRCAKRTKVCRVCGGYGRFLWGAEDHGECVYCGGTGRAA